MGQGNAQTFFPLLDSGLAFHLEESFADKVVEVLQIFLLSPLLLIHKELHGGVGEFAIEQDAEEVVRVFEWIF